MKERFIATRGSKLAVWQARKVQGLLFEKFPEHQFTLKIVETSGDRDRSGKLWQMGGKGLFTKELEDAVLSREADMAVHSLKDLPTELPKGLVLGAVPLRDDPRDVLVSKEHVRFEHLPRGARVGTSSLRRQSQIRALRDDLELQDVRGNVTTRMKKALEGPFDAVVLAKAGIQRLGLEEWITQEFSLEEILPAVGQGALAVEARDPDDETLEFLDAINDADSMTASLSERVFLKLLGGGCRMPIAAYAEVNQNEIRIQGLVASVDGKKIIRREKSGRRSEFEKIAMALAEEVLSLGARELLGSSHER